MSIGGIAEFFLPKNEVHKQAQEAPVVSSQPNEMRERRNKFAAKAQQREA